MHNSDQVRRQRNSPFAVFGVLALIFGIVGLVLLTGWASRTAPDNVAAAPSATSEVAAPNTSEPADPGLDSHDSFKLGADPLLADLSLPDTTCELPSLGRSEERLRDFYEATLDCLDAAWRPVLDAAGTEFEEARLNIDSSPSSICGEIPSEEEATGFYCVGVIHMPRDRVLEYLDLYRPAHLGLLAHEYGHHVQERVGILLAFDEEQIRVGVDSPAGLELSRRAELQANCFAGMFLASIAGHGSVSRGHASEAVRDFSNAPDSETHGTADNQLRWARIGFEANTTAQCDTWNAPANDVK